MEKETIIKDGFLLDKPIGGSVDENPDIDASYVEYWFNIWVDDEIDESVICANKPEDGTDAGIYVEQNITCPADRGSGATSATASQKPDKESIIYGSSGQPIGRPQGGVILTDEDDGECKD